MLIANRNYGQPFETDFLGALPAALKASTSKMDAVAGAMEAPCGTAYETLFAGMLAINVLLT